MEIWNTKITSSENDMWHPYHDDPMYRLGYDDGYQSDERRKEDYEDGWNDAVDEIKSELYYMKK